MTGRTGSPVIRGSSFSGLSFQVFVFEDEQRSKNKENKGVFVFGSSFSKMNKGAKIKKIRGS